MIAELVATGSEVPWLGDQLELRKLGILSQGIEEAGARIVAIGFAPQGDAEIEAEAIDAEGACPIAQGNRSLFALSAARTRRSIAADICGSGASSPVKARVARKPRGCGVSGERGEGRADDGRSGASACVWI